MKKEKKCSKKCFELPELKKEDWYFNDCPKGWAGHYERAEYQRELAIEELVEKRASTISEVQSAYTQGSGIGRHEEILGGCFDECRKYESLDNEEFPIFSSFRLDEERTLKHGNNPYKRFYRFEIDWALSDTRLVKAFEAWLEDARRVKEKSKRGTGLDKKPLRNLKALGIYRLLQRMPLDQAMAYAKQEKGMVYSQPEQWRRAYKLAQKILNERREDFK